MSDRTNTTITPPPGVHRGDIGPGGFPPAARVLTDLVAPWAAVESAPRGGERVEVTGIALDSRLIRPGDLYVAVPGASAHGAVFAAAAVAAGASAVLTDAPGRTLLEPELGVPVAVAGDVRGAMARVAAELYGSPAESLGMFAVTGTNGKTTTTILLAEALRRLGRGAGTIGTLGFRVDGEAVPMVRTTVTTPESVDLHALLALMRARGADDVAMEVSSHAMTLRRTEPIRFDIAAFTNLSPDHLDFHPDMEHYFEAKATLFTPEHAAAAVLNIDDEAGERIAARVRAAGLPMRTLSRRAEADYRIGSAPPGQVSVATPQGPLSFRLALPGDFNATNAVTALAMIELAGLDAHAAAQAMGEVSVPGRMQPVDLPAEAPAAYVDFAHTPDAVASALAAFTADRERGRRVIAVLGSGGDRDIHKREPMGRVAAIAADLVVVTDDNPRSEDPAAIRARVLAGARSVSGNTAHVIDGGDRRSAIAYALRAARTDDVVVVLGKGHEQGQDMGGSIIPFDDSVVIQQEWAAGEGERAWTR